ncbi:MAG: 3-dehydroquinate synthase [Clostridia bacterium]|nr:3-dehydroquinate synthase [Clostridia bacterium]
MQEIVLKTPSLTGSIYIGEDVLEARLPALTKGVETFVVTDSNVYALYKPFFEAWFSSAEIYVLPAGEEHKNFRSLYAILEKMAGAGLHRTARLFAVGGGVVGDIGGLAAALYMRGISCVQIPTTLLAQVDSSVGGKTAVDLGGVKNVVGAFYQPCEVLIDPRFLQTLPLRELKCGLGEIVKYASLNIGIFEALEKAARIDDIAFLSSLVYACVRHKANVVEADEKETGERKSLNVGHTTGHAIELSKGYSHGECVLYGMWFETQMAIEAGVCERAYGERLLRLVERALSCAPLLTPDFSEIEKDADKAKSDKKNVGDGKIVMAVPCKAGEWRLLALDYASYVNALVTLRYGKN